MLDVRCWVSFYPALAEGLEGFSLTFYPTLVEGRGTLVPIYGLKP